MPDNLRSAPVTAGTAGFVEGVDGGVAFGWAAPEDGLLPFVVIRLDSVPVGAGACVAEREPSDAGSCRHRFRIDLDHGRLALGGTVTAERIGMARARLEGVVVIEPDVPLATLSASPDRSFDKGPGLLLFGWIAVVGRAPAPPLRLAVNGTLVAEALLPSRLAADAWRAGGSLASGYAITIPIAADQPLPAEVRLAEEIDGRVVWEGSVDALDCLVEDVRALHACGADRHGNGAAGVATRILHDVRRHIAASTAIDETSNAFALDLAGWLAGSRAPVDALNLLLMLDRQGAMQGRSAVFLDVVATLLCDLPVGDLPRLVAWLDLPADAPARSRLLDYLVVLAETRRNGLADGGARLFRALAGIGYGQAAINWAWEALARSPAEAPAMRAFRRTLEMEVAALNIPFSAGFEFIAEDAE